MPVPLYKKFGLKFSLNDSRSGHGSGDTNSPVQNQDGRKPNDGPPDLDQFWREFNQRLNRLLGNRGGGGGGGFNPDMRGIGIGIAMIAVILASLWLVSGFFIVQEGQTGLVLTFGKYSHVAQSGFNWRWPYPIQNDEIVDTSQVRTVDVGYRPSSSSKQPRDAMMLTGDQNIVAIQFAVQYTVNNPVDWLFSNRDPEDTVRQVAETAIREVVGRNTMDFVLYKGHEKIELDVRQLMQQALDGYKLGVQLANVTMQGVQPPAQVQAAFDDAVKAEQDSERQENDARAYANEVIPKAHGGASQLQQEAEAYRARVIANAQGDAARFRRVLDAYEQAPAVTRDRMYLETMQQIFSNTTKLMITSKSGSNLLYLPIDKLIAQTTANHTETAKPPVNPPAASSSVPAASSSQSQDSQQQSDARSREGPESRDSRSRGAR